MGVVLVLGCALVGLIFILFSFPDLARLVDEAYTLGQELHLVGGVLQDRYMRCTIGR